MKIITTVFDNVLGWLVLSPFSPVIMLSMLLLTPLTLVAIFHGKEE